MKSTELTDFSDCLIELYRHAEELPIADFQDAALNLVKQIVPFDTSIWGTATMTPVGIDIHQIHLHKTSQDMLQAYELVKHEDTAAASVMHRGTSTDGFHSKTRFARTECGEFLRRFEHENFFVSMDTNRATSFMHWISLYRADPEEHCTNDERFLVETLRPHLMQALSLNRSRHLERTSTPLVGMKQGFAVADLRGVIYQTDRLFETLVRAEWPGWRENSLPPHLLQCLLGSNELFMGRQLVVRQEVKHGLLFLRTRKRCCADALTARERTIALRIAQGQTYKEIAQDLSRSPATVRNQIQAIYGKLEVSSIAGLIEAIQPLQ
jgi:DNA-binding CsgD family transcriptional regulator